MADFDVPMKRYRFSHQHGYEETYTLHCPFSIANLALDAIFPVRQRGGIRDTEIFFPKVKDLCLDLNPGIIVSQ